MMRIKGFVRSQDLWAYRKKKTNLLTIYDREIDKEMTRVFVCDQFKKITGDEKCLMGFVYNDQLKEFDDGTSTSIKILKNSLNSSMVLRWIGYAPNKGNKVIRVNFTPKLVLVPRPPLCA